MDSPAAATPTPRRKPLQPRNFDLATTAGNHPKPKPIAHRIPPPIRGSPGKENCPVLPTEPEPEARPREASLAEELAAVRQRRERLRADREKTEEVLRERDAVMQRWAVELEKRAEEQRNLELELRLLIKLQDLMSCSMIPSPVRSLREQEQQHSTVVQSQMTSPVRSLREKERQKSMEAQLQAPQSEEQNSEADKPSATQENETEK
ncbi:hypothetical protein OPV22_019756 [Ensete ventricosum]|uniref:Uncharacterized protein n=1 Tax=Ensete ventricosum TaxID=4639 RepID=A0AAV8Q8F6_ENSVE|nr:hypothetical protein OPV22_019756 [Ensete ventricosum]